MQSGPGLEVWRGKGGGGRKGVGERERWGEWPRRVCIW